MISFLGVGEANHEVFSTLLLKELFVASLVPTWALGAIVVTFHRTLQVLESKLTLLSAVANTVKRVKDDWGSATDVMTIRTIILSLVTLLTDSIEANGTIIFALETAARLTGSEPDVVKDILRVLCGTT